MSKMLKPAIQKHQKNLKHHVSDFFSSFLQSSIHKHFRSRCVLCAFKREKLGGGVYNFKSWNFFFLVLWYQNMMGIVVLTDLYKVLLIKSIISNHVNPLYSWSTYINTDKNNPENKEEDTDNPLIKWKTGQIKQSHSPQTESFCQSFDITQCLQPT